MYNLAAVAIVVFASSSEQGQTFYILQDLEQF